MVSLLQLVAETVGRAVARARGARLLWALGSHACCGHRYRRYGWFKRHRGSRHTPGGPPVWLRRPASIVLGPRRHFWPKQESRVPGSDSEDSVAATGVPTDQPDESGLRN